MSRSHHPRPRRALVAGALALSSLVGSTVLVELGYRALNSDPQKAASRRDLRDLIANGSKHYQPWAYTGFIPKLLEHQKGDPTRPHDWSFDFQGHDHPRIACLGGSTTWGGYPELLKRSLDELTGAEWDVMNWGVPGWTSAETMINYFTNVEDYQPDILILHHALNDVSPRTWGGYRSDYAHYRRPWTAPSEPLWERLAIAWSDLYADHVLRDEASRFDLDALVGQPKTSSLAPLGSAKGLEPGTAAAFERNMRSVVEAATRRGTRVVLMTMPSRPSLSQPLEDGSEKLWVAILHQHNQLVRELAAELDCLLVDAEAWSALDPEGTEPLFVDRVHMTPEGAKAKVNLLLVAMQNAGWQTLAR